MESAGGYISRRQLFRWGAAGLIAGATASLAGCAAPSSDAVNQLLIHGATGGGLKDSLDPHFPVALPDISRVRQLYEPLLRFDAKMDLEMAVAEEVESNADATEWTFRIRDGIRFHDGRPVRPEDVRASFARMFDPSNPAPYGADVAPLADLAGSRILDNRTFRLKLKESYAILDLVLASYTLGIIPEDFDLTHPIGTGPFKADLFVPGQRSRFQKFDEYWDVPATFEELVIIDFNDDAAKVNALLAGQVHTIDNLPTYLSGVVEGQGARTLISETGMWTPFTIRVDAAPFTDKRVRQAFRLIADRQQMIDQGLNGFGRLANDLYAPFDPDYIGNDLPQREQDLDQARSLLRAAGREGLQVELVTSQAVGTGGVESANLFVEQAKGAGVDVRLSNVDASIFFGEQYLSWVFAQSFWATRPYLPQASACALKSSAYNETHWYDETYAGLVRSAQKESDPARRTRLLEQAQQMEYEEGGYIIWGFKDQVDAYSSSLTGIEPAREQPMSSFRFNLVKPVETA